MPLKAARLINLLVVVLMLFEIVGGALTTFSTASEHSIVFKEQKSKLTLIATFLFQEAEEELENTEDELDRENRTILMDFSCVAFRLLMCHSLQNTASPAPSYCNLLPVYTLNCVFII